LKYLMKGANLNDINRDGSSAVIRAANDGLPGNSKFCWMLVRAQIERAFRSPVNEARVRSRNPHRG